MILVILGVAALLAATAAAGASSPADSLTAAEVASQLAEMSQLDGVQMSPDGAWVAYTVTRCSIATNECKVERLLQPTPGAGKAVTRPMPLALPKDGASVQWRPDSRCLSMVLGVGEYNPYLYRPKLEGDTAFACYDVATRAINPIAVIGKSVSPNYQWSPHGNYVAFTAPLAERSPLNPRRGVPHELIESGQLMALFVLDIRSGAVTQLTPDSMNVARSPGNFAWAPDERTLAVSIDRGSDSQDFDTDLVLIDRETRDVRPLVARAGMDGHPCWSSDGRWVAFTTHREDPAYRLGWPALVHASDRKVIDFPQDTTPMGFHTCHWSAVGRAFYYVAPLDMASSLVRAEAALPRARVLPQVSRLPLALESHRSFSANGQWMAFTSESPTTPAGLFVVELNAEGKPRAEPIRLTTLAPDFSLGRRIQAEALSWPSSDRKFTVHGLLLTPAAWSGEAVRRKLPTLLYFVGGPSMVRRDFADDGWTGVQLALAARGYAVLIPNTRGRMGYGIEFKDAIRTGRNQGRSPLADGLAGLDLLLARGIADADRMGVLGHSYGGYLTAYTITQTSRFKAAVIHEGAGFFAIGGGSISGPNDKSWALLLRDLEGVHNPFDESERARSIEESPGLHADRVRTPTLLLYGGMKEPPLEPYGASFPNVVVNGIPFYNGLCRFNVPTALFVYDETHVFVRPAAIADDLTRTAEWLDYWVRGMPFPDPLRAKEYGQGQRPSVASK